ncbi:MAG: cell division protein SepF [Selenomonadaceae bacterium]|nr:cell division protein SepF [Selenomonadaceae bacterium]
MRRINTLKPRSFDDVQLAANSLRQQMPVILNFENTDPKDKTRFIDFISGSVKAVNGEMYMISDDVYICAPTNVSLSRDIDKKSTF